jgi:DNA primase large subunit
MNSVEFGLIDLAKYPFLKEAGDYVKKWNIQIEDFNKPDYIPIIKRAEERVFEAIVKKKTSTKINEPEIEILSFPLALFLVKASGIDQLVSRFAHAESIRVENFLEEEKELIIKNVFKKVLNIDLFEIKDKRWVSYFNFKIHSTEYLKRAINFHELEWKLINRIVDQGYVYLHTSELIKLIREEIRKIINNKLASTSTINIPDSLTKKIDRIRAFIPSKVFANRVKEVSPEDYAPCVKFILERLKRGENISHYGRFLLTTYLLNVKKSVDEIMAIYPKFPDFRESLTRYQIEHIAGLRGGKVQYKVPSCRTLLTHNLCCKIDKLCDNIRNPLQFSRSKSNFRSKNKK